MSKSDLSPFVFSNHTDFLKAVRNHYGDRRHKISLKVWATRLGYRSSRSLEQVLSGERLPSENLLFRLGQNLKLTAIEVRYLGLMVQREKQILKKKPVQDFDAEMNRLRPLRYEAQYINNEVFRRVSEWYPLVIRQLALTPHFKNDLNWIAHRLRGKLTTSQIAAALSEWQRLSLESRTIYTQEDVPSQAVRTFHRKMLYKAAEAIDEFAVDEREFISLTFRTSKKNIPRMKKILRSVRDQLNEELSDDSGEEVFQLCLALFPHTNLNQQPS